MQISLLYLRWSIVLPIRVLWPPILISNIAVVVVQVRVSLQFPCLSQFKLVFMPLRLLLMGIVDQVTLLLEDWPPRVLAVPFPSDGMLSRFFANHMGLPVTHL